MSANPHLNGAAFSVEALVAESVAERLRPEIAKVCAAIEDGQRRQSELAATELRSLHDEIARLRELLTVERWVSRRTAAESRGVSVDTIDRRIADGSIRSQRLGRSVRVLLAAPATDEQIAELSHVARGGNR